MGLEIIHLDTEGEFWLAQCAVNNRLAVPFSFHKSVRDEFQNDRQFFDYLQRQSEHLLEQYGDARQWPEKGFKEVAQGEFDA